jgi:hypothetical protein
MNGQVKCAEAAMRLKLEAARRQLGTATALSPTEIQLQSIVLPAGHSFQCASRRGAANGGWPRSGQAVTIVFEPPIPILRIFSVERAKEVSRAPDPCPCEKRPRVPSSGMAEAGTALLRLRRQNGATQGKSYEQVPFHASLPGKSELQRERDPMSFRLQVLAAGFQSFRTPSAT